MNPDLSLDDLIDHNTNRLQMLSSKRIISILLLLIGLVSSNLSFAKNDTRQILNQLSATSTVRSQFKQTKKIASINKTFTSNGTVLFSKPNGVIWQIQRPVNASLVVTQQKLIQKTARTYSEIQVSKSPYGAVASLFSQLLSGNERLLSKNFNVVSAKYTANRWNIVLTPKTNLFKKLFVRVEVQGRRYVDQIVILEKANNSTVIQFSQQRNSPTTLTAGENALFKLAK